MRKARIAVVSLLALVACDYTLAPKAGLVPQADVVNPREEKGRYEIVRAQGSSPDLVLLDTATGKSWQPCSQEGLQGGTAWCEMPRGQFATRETKPKSAAR